MNGIDGELLKECISECCEDSKTSHLPSAKKPQNILARAAVNTGVKNAEAENGNGWVCGTNTSRLREIIARKLKSKFSAGEMQSFIAFCAEKTRSSTDEEHKLEAMLAELLLMIPKVHVNYRESFAEMLDKQA